MNENQESPSGNLPAVQPLCAVSVPFDQLGPEDAARVMQEMYDLVVSRDGKSEPAKVSAAKLLLDRLAPPVKDPEQLRREAEEREAAIVDARRIMAEHADAKRAGLCQPLTLDQASPAATTDAAGDEN